MIVTHKSDVIFVTGQVKLGYEAIQLRISYHKYLGTVEFQMAGGLPIFPVFILIRRCITQ